MIWSKFCLLQKTGVFSISCKSLTAECSDWRKAHTPIRDWKTEADLSPLLQVFLRLKQTVAAGRQWLKKLIEEELRILLNMARTYILKRHYPSVVLRARYANETL